MASGSYSVVFTAPFSGVAASAANPLPVTVVDGQAVTGANGGFYVPAQIAGFVYSDDNGNGTQDGSEGDLDGVTVNLIDSNNTIVATQTSGPLLGLPHGVYEFTGVKPGSYSIQVVQAGNTSRQPLVATGALTAGQQLYGFNVGVVPAPLPGLIAGTVFTDANGNGTRDPGEAGLAGVAVTLENAAGATVATTTSDSQGAYGFTSLAAGSYQVTFAAPSGMVADAASPLAETLSSGQAITGADGGFYASAVIAGQVYSDANSDGTYETGEGFVDGAAVNLIDSNGNIVATTTSVLYSSFDGFYAFYNVKPGTYEIQAVVPGLTVQHSPQSTGALVSGQALYNFEIATPAVTSAISGTVFSDTNGDGQLATGEAGLAGVSVLLIKDPGTSYAKAVKTTLTDSAGHYAFNGTAPGNYAVVVATPAGLESTSQTTVSVPGLVNGQQVTANVGFATDPTPDATAFPVVTTVNLIVRGQSNATYFTSEGYLAQLKTAVEHELGFDGVNQKVNLIADYNTNGYNSLNPGTGLVEEWLSAVNGDYTQGWTAQPLELGFLSDLARQPDSVKAAPTLVLWLHNESDSEVPGLTTAEWTSAVQYEAGLVRAVFGQTASTMPYLFVDAIPFWDATIYPQLGTLTPVAHDTSEQSIKIGMSQLADDPVFNGSIVAQESDVTMAHDGTIGGAHLGVPDQQQLLARLTVSIADQLSASALPGSPLALAGGHVDSIGPQVIAAVAVTGNAHQLLLTIQQDSSTGFEALNSVAAAGTGWSIRNNATGADTTLEATGNAAQVIDGTHLLITFDQTIPANGLLFYNWGSGRIVADPTLPGNGNAVYDTNSLPIWADPSGVAINANAVVVPTPPAGVISGVAYLDANANGIEDRGETGLAGVTVILKDATGATISTATSDSQGRYTFPRLVNGTYAVTFTAPSGYVADISAVQTAVVANQAATVLNSGFYVPAQVAGFVFNDANGNSTQDSGESDLDGVTVNLLDASGQVFATTTSSPNFGFPHGVYYFGSVKPGSYSIQTVIPGATTAQPLIATGALAGGQQLFAFNVGVEPAAPAFAPGSISGTVFTDTNGNNAHDTGEAGIAGVTVTLDNAAGATVATATSDSNGAYTFTGVTPGSYNLVFAPPSGTVPDKTGATAVTVASGQAVTGADSGFYQGAQVAGFVADPASGASVDGIIVNLLDSTGAVVATTTSGPLFGFPHGVFDFAGLKPGVYSIDTQLPGSTSTSNPQSIGTLVSGQTLGGLTIQAPAGSGSIAGTIFTDTNGNGTQQNGESGLAGVSLVLIKDPGTVTATALATMVSDAQGHYNFSGLSAGNYAVVAATRLGLQGTSPIDVSVSGLGNGQTVTANFGFDTNPTPNATPLPASTTLNIVLRGQSNATYFMQAGFLTKLQQDVQNLLGFDGINQKINIVGDTGDPTDSTLYPGTGLTTDWLSQIGGSYTNGWTANSQELGLLTDLARQSAVFKSAPTAILYLHNESDSLLNPNLTVAQWESAVQFEAGLVRGILGQSASTTPYQFVNAIPFVDAYGVPADREDQANQSIRIGMYDFAANAEFNASVVAQSSDVDMNHDGPDGGAHLNTGVDDTQLEYRLAQSLAMTFAASALPGSPVALANGNLDDKGPQVIAAAAVSGNTRQLLITVSQDQAAGFLALDATAAQGVGWSIRNSAVGATSTLQASGTAAQLVDSTHILLTFNQPIQPGGSLFYAWGAERLSTTSTSPGEGNAVYDTNNMPIWADPNGVAITGAAALPPGSISGMAFNDANANGSQDIGDNGFAGVIVTLKDSSGALVSTVTTGADGTYTFYGLVAGQYAVSFAAPSGSTLDTTTTVNVTVGTTAVTGPNAGVWQGAEVAGFVTDPASGADVDGITVNLLDPTGAIVATTTSGPLFGFPHGVFDFTGLKPGVYSVETQRPGTTATSVPLAIGTLVSGQALTGLTLQAPVSATAIGSIAGTAFLDANGNGTQDSSETALAGVAVTLKDTTGATISTATSDSQGRYTFSGLANGSYSVTFTAPSGYAADIGAAQTAVVASQAATVLNGGFYVPAQIAGFIYNDANSNGTQDGSEGDLDGVTVNLIDSNNTIVASQTSGPLFSFPHGVYYFTAVKPGSYHIQIVQAGDTSTQPSIATGTLVSGQQLFNFNIGVIPTAVVVPSGPNSISGTVYTDANGNGTYDTGETGIAGVTVTLENSAGAPVATATSNSQGAYGFANVAPGSYQVVFTPPVGTVADTAKPILMTLSSGQAITGVNSGFYVPGDISGTVTLDGSSTLVNGITVALIDATGKIVATTMSSANQQVGAGAYDFDNVRPGTYTVQAIIPNAVIPPVPSAAIQVASGQRVTQAIGLQDTSTSGIDSIVGFAFNDANGNGVLDSGETVVVHDTVTVVDANGHIVATTTTDGTGRYEVDGLANGAYTVSFGQPSGGGHSATVGVRLSDTQRTQAANGAFYTPATVSGTVFIDANGNGVLDNGEGGASGVSVQLLDSNGLTVESATTGSDGRYSFTDVKAGSYSVQFATPNGDIATTPAVVSLPTVVAGQTTTAKAGVQAASGLITLSGTAFIDANQNGVKDAGEAGLAHENVVLVTKAGTAVQTAVTDANGNYTFANVANGAYSVIFATPSGDIATTPTTVQTGVIAAGQTKSGLNAGFVSNPRASATPIPAATTINIILRGQSNSQYFTQDGMLAKLQADIEAMLGFDGVTQKVNLLADFFTADGVNTINSGTALIGQWLTPVNGDYTQGWSATSLELGLLTDIARQSDAFKAAPTAVVWLHNETDTNNNPNVTPDEWESAARFEAGLVRGVLGQDASTVPYLFVNAIPFPSNGALNATTPAPAITPADQAIRIGMAALAADSAFNAIVAAQSSDVTMDANLPGTPGGAHMDANDDLSLEQRLAASIADTFSASALPGSPLALAGGNVDNLGPQVIAATTVAGHANQLLLTLQQDSALALNPLSDAASEGVGWSLRNSALGSDSATLEASGTKAQVVDSTHLLVTFDNSVPAGALLFYGWGSARIAPTGAPGTGDAAYDSNGLPAWANPNGVAVATSSVTVGSSISGTLFLDLNGNGVIDAGDTTAIPGFTVTLTDASGVSRTTTTDQFGAYSFAITTPGTYTVAITPPAGTFASAGTASQTVTLAANQIVANVNAGLYVPAEIVGVAFNSANNAGLDGVTAELLNAAGAVVATTVTSNTNPLAAGVDGVYSFANVAPGSYSVRFTPPAGDTATTPALNNIGAITSGQVINVNGGFRVPTGSGSIAGTVFADANNNGTRDAGETGIPGDTVGLENAAGVRIATATSDSSGNYSFAGLAEGTYSVVFGTPSGATAGNTALQNVVIANGQAVTGINAGFAVQPAVIAGQVYSDTNADGTKNGSESFLDGVTVNLLDGSGNIVATTTSVLNGPFDGFYAFTNVMPGSYHLQAVMPGAATSQPLIATGSLTAGQDLFNFGIGVVPGVSQTGNGSIAGTVFEDTNGNGTLDTGETAIANEAVTLANAAGATVAATTSDAQGHYSFSGLPAGTYSVGFASQSGASLLPDTGLTQTVVVANGQAVTANEGFFSPATIAGFVYTDSNGNGVLDGSEVLVDGVTVNLLDTSGTVVATTVSAANAYYPHGVYTFTNVKPGSYQIQVVIPNAPAPQPTYATGTITAGQNFYGFNIGIENVKAPAGTGSITGTAFTDLNANGTSDTGDTGLNAVAVTLTDATGATVATTSTNSSGQYSFTGLTGGTYAVSFTAPSGYVADSTKPLTVTVTSQAAAAPAAGFYQPAAIAGFITSATDGATLDGVRVNLIDANGTVVATTVSGPEFGFAHGVYSFFGVKPGIYTVQPVIPNALTPPSPAATGALVSAQNLFNFSFAIANTALGGTASISGTAFLDANGNATFDTGDTALSSDVVTLSNANGQVVAITATDSSGNYTFGGLAAGSYIVTFERSGTTGQEGYKPAAPQTVTLANGKSLTGVNGAFAATAAIYGTVFNDLNGDGLAEAGDTGVDGLTVQLLNSDRDPIGTATTGANAVYQTVVGVDGSYSFTGLQPGTYTVRFVAPNGDILTTPTLNIEHLTAGQAVQVNAGVTSSTGTIAVSGLAYTDTNGNGTEDAGETGLGGINVVLIKNEGTPSASAVATTVTDADGNYSFTGIANGTYSVVFSRPDGETPTTPTTVSLGALTTGSAVRANAGFTASPPPSVPGPYVQPPASMPSAAAPFTLSIIIRGQSNSQNLAALNNQDTVNSLQSQIEALLGFNGTTQQVKVLSDYGKANGDNTINSGTKLIGDWLAPIDGNYQNGWSAQSLELGFLSDISQNKASLDAGPTAVVWLHNESDSTNPNLTTSMWESAVQYEAGLVRGLLGQNVPYEFVNAIPFGFPADGGISEQAIKVGMSDLAADPSFNGAIAAQSADVAADKFGAGYNGGHLDDYDLQQLLNRLSLSLADTFSSYALPGSPLAQAGGNIDNKGPQVIAATTVAGNANQLLLTVQQDQATSFDALSAAAAIGTGWSIRNNAAGPNSTLLASGTAAAIVDGTHLLVTFDNAVPVGGELFYGWGSGLIAPAGQTGIGAAVYDNNGLPIWTDGNGVTVAVPDTVPPVVTASATAVAVQATSALGAIETFTGSVTDNVDGTSDLVVYTEQLSGGATKVVHSGDTFGLGTHTIVASATDAAGNKGSAAPFSFSVVDTTAPVVKASATAATVQATSALGAVERFKGSASDAVDGTSDLVVYTEQLSGGATKVVHSGDTFALGTHTIVASATDAAGNKGSAAPFSFSVVATAVPVVTASANAAAVQATSKAGAVETFTGSAADAVDGTDLVTYTELLSGGGTKTVHSGDTFALGSHTIVASATNSLGNTGTSALGFSVVDTTAPLVTASATIATVQAASPSGAVATFTGSASDAVDGTGDPVVYTEQLAGGGAKTVHSSDTFAVGSHTIVASATDAAGNTGTATFGFSVADTTAPLVTASATAASLQATSSAGAVATFTASASDAVDGTGDLVVYTEQLAGGATQVVHSGDTFAVGSHTIVASATDAAGNTGTATFGFSVMAAPPTTVTGKAIDGYLAGATVFADANGNGILDAGEVSTTTDAQGNFTLAAGSASLVATGGTDITTHVAFAGTLTAPSGSTVVTALTTLVQQVARLNGGDVAKAQASVKSALGLSTSANLTGLDPIAATQSGQAGAGQAYATAALLLNTTALINAAGGSGNVYGALAAQIVAAPTLVDLTNSTTLAGLASAAGASTAQAQAAATLASASNTLLTQQVQAAGGNAAMLLANVAAVSTVAQGTTAAALMAASNDPARLAQTVAANSGSSLAGAVTAAGGTPASPPLTAADTAAVALHQSVTGNVLANDTVAQRGDGLSVTAIRFGTGSLVQVPATGSVTVAADLGQLTIASNGAYSFLADENGLKLGQTATESFAYTATETNGGTATGALAVAVTGAAPQAAITFGFALTQANVVFKNGVVLLTGPDGVVHDVSGIRTLTFTDGTVQETPGSLVDNLFYDANNHDVWAAHMDPTFHYDTYGWKEGRDPNADFSTKEYLQANPDVAAAGVDPLQHYDTYGWKEGRDPSLAFSTSGYLAANPDVAAAHIDPLLHYLQYGDAEGRSTVAVHNGSSVPGTDTFTFKLTDAKVTVNAKGHDIVTGPDGSVTDVAGVTTLKFTDGTVQENPASLVDNLFYDANNHDVWAAHMDPTFHYDTYGWKEGRDPDAFFSTKGYLHANPDVAAAGVNPLLHYDTYGWKEGRDPGAAFSTNGYLSANPDVAAAHIDPLQHFLQYGIAEGRSA